MSTKTVVQKFIYCSKFGKFDRNFIRRSLSEILSAETFCFLMYTRVYVHVCFPMRGWVYTWMRGMCMLVCVNQWVREYVYACMRGFVCACISKFYQYGLSVATFLMFI